MKDRNETTEISFSRRIFKISCDTYTSNQKEIFEISGESNEEKELGIFETHRKLTSLCKLLLEQELEVIVKRQNVLTPTQDRKL